MLFTSFDKTNKKWTGSTVGRLPRHDLYFGTPVNSPTAGIPLGDGDTGSLLWLEKDAIHIHVNKCDLWQDAPQGASIDGECVCSGREEELTCQKHAGEILLRFDAPVFDYLYQKKFAARLSLADASAVIENETPFGKLSLRAFCEARSGVTAAWFWYKRSAEPCEIRVDLRRFGSRTLWRWYCQQQPSPETGLDGTESFAGDGGLYITQELNATKFCIGLRVVPVSGTLTAARRNSHTAELRTESAQDHLFVLYYTVKTGKTVEEAKQRSENALASAVEIGADALYQTHRADWAAFWDRSFLHIGDDYLENLWYLYFYTMNSESRGAYPPHFTSGLWGFYHDFIPWVYYFHYNLQHMYAPLDAAGHGELAKNYYDLRRNGLSAARLYAQRVKKKKGAFVHDVTDRYGRGADYDSLNCTPASQIAMQMYRHWRYTGDEDFLNTYALPAMRGAAEFYLDLIEKGDDGLYHIRGTTAYEGNAPTDDTLTDQVMIRALFSALLPFEEGDKTDRLSDVLAHLPGPVVTELLPDVDWDGEKLLFGLGKGKKPRCGGKIFGIGYREGKPARKMYGDPESPLRGYGFPDIELSPLYPAGIFGLKDRGTPEFDLMHDQLMLHPGGGVGMHWTMLPVYLARMGRGDLLFREARVLIATNQGFPNGFCAETGEGGSRGETPKQFYTVTNTDTHKTSLLRPEDFTHFDFETVPIIAMGLCETMLQSHEGALRVFPAVTEADAAFRLYAEGGFAVCAEKTGADVVITVESLRGETCRVILPESVCNKKIYAYIAPAEGAFTKTGYAETAAHGDRIFDFPQLKKGETLLLCSVPIGELRTAVPAPESLNADMKRLGEACLGSPRLMG